MNTVNMIWGGVGGTPNNYSAQLGNQYVPSAAGVIAVAQNDIVPALNAGWVFAFLNFRKESFTAPLPATVGKVVASAALSNGALTIANQTDVARPFSTRIDPGVSAITAGTVTHTYVANDGTTTVDVVSLVAAANTPVTTRSTKGCLQYVSGVVAGLVGGTTPKVQVDTTAALAVPVSPNALSFTESFESTDGVPNAVGVVSSVGIITPTTAPNGTHNYSMGYSFYFS